MSDYKLSKYNFYKQFDDNTYVCCNLVEKVFFGLSSTKYHQLITNSDNLSIVREENPHLFSAMQKLGIIVDTKINETNKIILRHREQIYNNQTYRMTIMPTLDCNFNCWYCYEEHPRDIMSDKTQKAIVKYVIRTLDETRPKLFSLDWFGGEPLMAFDNVVYTISSKIKNECAKRNIPFSNGITTNGALITRAMCKKLNHIALTSYQITLDGSETFHNQVKKAEPQRNEYRNILSVLQYLCDSIDNIRLLVRINYSPKNIDSVYDIITDLPNIVRDKAIISFQQVWQTQNEQMDEKIRLIIDEFTRNGFNVEKPNIENSFYKCYADVKNQIVIAPNGNIFKCTARDFINEEPDGRLMDDGTIKWERTYFNRMCKTTVENEKCQNCKLLPACWGPCSQKLLDYRPCEFEKICNYMGIEKTIENMMSDFYKLRIRHEDKITHSNEKNNG